MDTNFQPDMFTVEYNDKYYLDISIFVSVYGHLLLFLLIHIKKRVANISVHQGRRFKNFSEISLYLF